MAHVKTLIRIAQMTTRLNGVGALRRRLPLGALLLLLLPVLLLAACGGNSDNEAAAAGGEVSSERVVVDLAEENRSGESGTATLTATGDRTSVVLELRNPTTGSQPAHIHEGSCGPALNPQPLHGLLNVMQGRSETIVNAPLSELTAGGLAINVHHSNENLDRYVACGNLPGATDDSTSPLDDGGLGY
jgi:Cu/Zn superoxide dismutase